MRILSIAGRLGDDKTMDFDLRWMISKGKAGSGDFLDIRQS